MSRLRNLPQAADYTGFTERFLRSLVFRKEIPHYKRGGRLYFSTDDLDAYIEAGRIETKRDCYLETQSLGPRRERVRAIR